VVSATPGSIRKKQKRSGRRAVEKAGPWKERKTKGRFSSLPTALGIPHNPRDSTFPTAPTAAATNNY